MKVYSLSINDRPLVEIDVDVPRWFPVRPVVNHYWLRNVVAGVVRDCFSKKPRFDFAGSVFVAKNGS